MKKTFQKTLIAAATGVVMLSAAGTASANSLLFPYFTTATGAQSVLTLTNTGTAAASQAVHYVYNYGAGCTHYDATGSLTANDTLSHSIADKNTAGGFGVAVSGDTSKAVYFPTKDTTGFLVVSSKSTGSTDALRGHMVIVDPASGLSVAYPGIDNALDTSVAANEGNFASITDKNFPLNWYPSSMVTTSWYGVVTGDMSGVIASGANWTGTATFSNQGVVYDNEETAYSGTVTKSISCLGTITPTDLMTGAQKDVIGTAKGGLIKAAVTGGTGSGVVMMKMQKVEASVGSPFAGRLFMHREQGGF